MFLHEIFLSKVIQQCMEELLDNVGHETRVQLRQFLAYVRSLWLERIGFAFTKMPTTPTTYWKRNTGFSTPSSV
jgi:hypothetical protein